MKRDDRLYAFIVARTSRSRSRIRRICIHRRWLKVASIAACLFLCAALYGLYGVFREAAHLRIERENMRLRVENEKQRRQLDDLKNRVDAVEDASRRIAEISGISEHGGEDTEHGKGGPLVKMDAAEINAVIARTDRIEQKLHTVENVLREQARMPSIWPVTGETTDGFGVRHDPFGGGSSEFHTGQDIATAWGTPVAAAGTGTIIFAGTQSGYGQVVIIDHGGGLTTLYGHLSRIEVAPGQPIKRGATLGCVGSTGRSTGPHLHYEVRINDEPVCPRSYLPLRANGNE